MMAGSLKAVDVLAHLQRNKVAQRLARSGNRGAGGSREPAYCLGLRARGPSQRAMSMSATANVFSDGLFNLGVDVVPRINRSSETGIFFWRRIFSGRAGADGGLLPENRRQRIVENPSRGMRLRTKLTPFFVWLHQRASRGADCSAMSTSIVCFADSNASLWMSSRAATDTESVPPARDLSSRSSTFGGKRISVSTLTLSSKRLIEIEMLYPRCLYCGTCTSAATVTLVLSDVAAGCMRQANHDGGVQGASS